MWNLLKRMWSVFSFPIPKWPPIQSVDTIDITGQREDGGVDLIIIASQPIDDSPETLESIRQKVQTYLAVIHTEEFQAEMGNPPRDKIAIILACTFPIHATAHSVIAQCKVAAASKGVSLEIRDSVDATNDSWLPDQPKPEQTMLPLTESDRIRISSHIATVRNIFQVHFGDDHIIPSVTDLNLLQRFYDDGALHKCAQQELDSIGVVFGEFLAHNTPLHWITIEWQSERILALKYPNSAVFVFPDGVIAKRFNAGEQIEFASLYRSIADQVEKMKDDPEYKR